jgi:L-aspartate oxidase
MPDALAHRRYLIPFRSQLLPHIFTDTLVIGGGVAGMRAAIEAAGCGSGAEAGEVILLVKNTLEVSSTAWAQGGIAAAHAADDTPQSHLEDTLAAGAGLCHISAVQTLVDEGPARIDELIEWGMPFDRDDAGAFAYGREGAHSRHRILHAGGAATGEALARTLAHRVHACDSIRIFDRCFVLDLLTLNGDSQRGNQRVLGAITHHPKYGLQIIWAKSTILACGGAGQVYRETTNPKITTGDGIAMAYRAGAALADLEFVQFHPTTLYIAGAGRMLISEAVRGEGALLVDSDGVRFMPEYHDLAELAPRDVVSRAIVDRLTLTQKPAVYLDTRHFGRAKLEERFPNLVQELTAYDLDPSEDLIPVHPSAHYTIGGVWADLDGRTSLPGLFACGEAAANGLHGANRLASNSLLEGLVYGRRAGRAAAQLNGNAAGPIRIVSTIPVHEHAELDLVDVRSSLRSAMWRNVGIERIGSKLSDVLEMFRFWARYTMDIIFDEPAGWETQNLLTVGALMTRAALWRCESRGVHCRLDHPEPRDDFAVHAQWRAGVDEPVVTPLDATIEAST